MTPVPTSSHSRFLYRTDQTDFLLKDSRGLEPAILKYSGSQTFGRLSRVQVRAKVSPCTVSWWSMAINIVSHVSHEAENLSHPRILTFSDLLKTTLLSIDMSLVDHAFLVSTLSTIVQISNYCAIHSPGAP